MQFHNISRKNPLRKKRQVGRGGKRGKTSGRGTKGQKARAGHKIRPEIRDMIKRIPKLRGRGKNSFKSFQVKSVTVSLLLINKFFDNGSNVTPETLLEKGLISNTKGNLPGVKILSTGDLTKKVSVAGCEVSKGAKVKIIKLGGSVS